MNAEAKNQLVPTEHIFICVPGDTPDTVFHTDTGDESTPARRRRTRTHKPPSDESSSSSSYGDRLRSSRKVADVSDNETKPIFPPPIDLTLNQDKCAVVACSFDKLRNERYFVDNTDLISSIYSTKARAKYYCFPRAGSKSTVVSELIHWLFHDDRTRVKRLNNFKNTKIMTIATSIESNVDKEGNLMDSAFGFNQYIIVKGDFSRVEIEDLNLENIKFQVGEEFASFLRSRYEINEDVLAEITKSKASTSAFFGRIVREVNNTLPRASSDSNKRPALLIIDNFDAPALRILNKTKSTEVAVKVMNFFNSMLSDIPLLEDFIFEKIILFGTHQPIGMNTKSNLKKIIVESYPYGSKDVCSKFFFCEEDVRTLLKNYGEEESVLNNLVKICGQFNIGGSNYFHPGSIVNYIHRSREYEIENPVYWSSVDSLDILADLSFILPYEMVLWTLQEDQVLEFNYQKLLKFDKLSTQDEDTAYSYLLEAGYLTLIDNADRSRYKIVNKEARNLFYTRYKEWCDRIPSGPKYEPLHCFGTGDYHGFFEIANHILKTNYAGEDFQYEGQYHVFLSSFFHNVSEWHFKSNNQAGYGRYDFVTWNKNPLADTGYVFEIAILKPDNNPKQRIANKILEKKKQVEDREYFLEVKKPNVKCIVVVGCRKMLSYTIYNVSKSE